MDLDLGLTPELSRDRVADRRGGTRYRVSRAAKRSRLERIVRLRRVLGEEAQRQLRRKPGADSHLMQTSVGERSVLDHPKTALDSVLRARTRDPLSPKP